MAEPTDLPTARPEFRLGAEMRARLAEAWPRILERVAEGALIGQAIKAEGFSRSAVRYWRGLVPGADAEMERAKEECAHALLERLFELEQEKPVTSVEATDKRTRMDILRWAIQKLCPRVYSDKIQHDVTVKHLDMTKTIAAAQARLDGRRSPRIFENGEETPSSTVAPQPVTPARDPHLGAALVLAGADARTSEQRERDALGL